MSDKLRLGMVGFGGRGIGMLKLALLPLSEDEVDLVAVCDLYQDRVEEAQKLIEEKHGYVPFGTTNYKDLLTMDNVDAIIIMSSWESHVDIACAAMKAGKPVGMEVGCAYSLDDCWRLIHTYEETGIPCMMLENCCYGKRELMILNMVKKGVFGDVVHCEGGYMHDLRDEIITGKEKRHYRLRNYMHRNCHNYPTHELGPICKILNINNGNRLLSLTSVATPASKGLHEYVISRKGPDHELANVEWKQADVVKTNIICANGEMISLTLDTTLPRTYCRNFTVRGTKANYFELNDSLYIDQQDGQYEFKGKEMWGCAEKYEEEYLHPLWKGYTVNDGHGGMDTQVFRAFINAVKLGINPPIDTYDTVLWMSIAVLSEMSIAAGGAPVAVPDFTNGKWMERTDIVDQKYGLNKIIEIEE